MDQTGFDRMEFDYDYSLDWFSQSSGLLDTSSVPDPEKFLLEAEDNYCGHYAAKKEVKIGHEQALTSDHDYSLPGKSSDDLKTQINDDLPSSNDISNNQFENQEDWVNELLNPITPGGINSSTDTAEVLDNIPAQCTTINGAGTEDFSVRSPDSTNLSVSAKSRKRKASGTSSSACSTGLLGCTSKNAIAARENRLKKKKYVEELENRNKQLEKENQLVIDQADKREERIRELEMRNAYLENVLRNESTLSSLLGNLEPVSEVRLSIASQGGRKKQRRGHDGTTNEGQQPSPPSPVIKTKNFKGLKQHTIDCRRDASLVFSV